jgi:hypothetical protein
VLFWIFEWLSDLSPAGLLFLFLLYFTPTIAALFRKRNWILKLVKVFCLNFLLGWTLFGWYAAWKYALAAEPRFIAWFVAAMKAWWKRVEEEEAKYLAERDKNASSNWAAAPSNTPTFEFPPIPQPTEYTYICPNGIDGLKTCVSCKGTTLPCHDCGGWRRVYCSDCQGTGTIRR